MKISLVVCAMISISVILSVESNDIDDYEKELGVESNEIDGVELNSNKIASNSDSFNKYLSELDPHTFDSIPVDYDESNSDESEEEGFTAGDIIGGLFGIQKAQAAKITKKQRLLNTLDPKLCNKVDTWDNLWSLHVKFPHLVPVFQDFIKRTDICKQRYHRLCIMNVGKARTACFAALEFGIARAFLRLIWGLRKHEFSKGDIVRVSTMVLGEPNGLLVTWFLDRIKNWMCTALVHENSFRTNPLELTRSLTRNL